MSFKYESIEELVSYAKEAEGQYLVEIDTKDIINKTNKGSVGAVIEQSFFGYSANSKAEADFADVGIELKTTGVVRQKRGTIAAKERLVLNIINYMDEVNRDFLTSSFWSKNNKLLIFFYTYIRNNDGKPDYNKFQILKTILHEFSEKDLEIIRQDWDLINSKIKLGLAHELSEGDTQILGACTKGASRKSIRKQPFSDIPAKQRAYSLKQGYMTSLVRQYIKNEHLTPISSVEDLKDKTIGEIIEEKFESYLDKSEMEILKLLKIKESKAKNRAQLLTSGIFGITGTKLDKIEEFSKLNIKFKTITYEGNGNLKESMSFENLNFNDIYYSDWEESELKMKFESTQWLFIVFQKNNQGERILRGNKLWSVPKSILNKEIKDLFYEVKTLLKSGLREWQESGKFRNNLPKSDFNGVCHIRPKGQTREKSMVRLPNGQKFPNQAFWFNSKFIKQLTKSLL